MPAWLRSAGAASRVTVHVQPGAKRTELVGEHGDALKIRLAAPPVDGKANEALLAYLAERLGLPRRELALKAGANSRRKQIEIALAPDRLVERLGVS